MLSNFFIQAFIVYLLSSIVIAPAINAPKPLRFLRLLFNFKPFTCFLCMSVWLSAAINLTMYFKHYHTFSQALVAFLAVAGITQVFGRLTGLLR